MKKWQNKRTEVIFDDPHFRLCKDIIQVSENKELGWLYWDARDSVMIVGVTPENKLILVNQYRYLYNGDTLEFPAGSSKENETLEDAAKREMEEETGYTCNKLIELGAFYETIAQLNRRIHIFLAPNVIKSPRPMVKGEDFEDCKPELFDIDEVIKMVREGKIIAMGTALAASLAKDRLDNHG